MPLRGEVRAYPPKTNLAALASFVSGFSRYSLSGAYPMERKRRLPSGCMVPSYILESNISGGFPDKEFSVLQDASKNNCAVSTHLGAGEHNAPCL
ncbi:hypothetical protein ACHAXS_003246 [Conticribra weissflogii]